MASRPSSRLAELFHHCLPHSRQRPNSDPTPVPAPTQESHLITPKSRATRAKPSPPNPSRDLPSSAPQGTKASDFAALGTLKAALAGLQATLEVFPPLQVAVGGLLSCLSQLQTADCNRRAYEEIVSDLANIASRLQAHISESKPTFMPYSVANVARCIEEQTRHIQGQQARSKARQLSDAAGDEEDVINCYRRLGALLQQLQMDISLSIWDAIRQLHMDAQLDRLSPTHGAYYNAALSTSATKRAGCTENTRVDVLDHFKIWSRLENGTKLLWMNGMAGTGKTTIAYSLCEQLERDKQLGASFFCSRISPRCRDVNRIIPTIAYQLARYSNAYRSALCQILGNEPDVARKNIAAQFENLIADPLMRVKSAMPLDTTIVIDALDECSDVSGIKLLLDMLLRYSINLPVKFFITSRPEPGISEKMIPYDDSTRSILRLHDIERSLVQEDIKTYLTAALVSIHISRAEVEQLATHAGTLFIFAATAVRYILPEKGSVDCRQRLSAILALDSSSDHKSYRDIDKLYSTILANALDAETLENIELEARRRVLWSIVCSREPLSIPSLVELLGLADTQDIELAIQPLQSVIHISQSTGVVSTLHASFPDFLLNSQRSGRFHCDQPQHSEYLAECCFRLMEQSLRFNICGLETSYCYDRDAPNIQERIEQAISPSIFHASRYWGDYVSSSTSSARLYHLINDFLQYRLLFWMEVLNLKCAIGHGDSILVHVLNWLPTDDASAQLRAFLFDARSFVTTFATNPTSLSTPHIYVSVLPFTPKRSLVWSNYWSRTNGLIWSEGTAIEARGSTALATWNTGSTVNGIALSGDGKRMVSDSLDGTVVIWDVSKGDHILGPLDAGQDTIWCVAFSIDGKQIAAGSRDSSICIWDAHNGSLVAGPLKGHSDSIASITFSHDCSLLASGSQDHTIRLWDARLGVPVGGALEGHSDSVWSVAFSPNDRRVASGSHDRTIRLWSLDTGAVIGQPLEGHTGEVNSVAISPDGLRIVSGSHDCTIRVWDIDTGTTIVGPLLGHTSNIYSVSFSPDGELIVSGSDDNTVRVWHSIDGVPAAEPFEGHEDAVNSVVFSPDGTRIFSGSSDYTICTWDKHHGTALTTKSPGHKGAIHSVALSPDGARAVSGSSDHTLFIWETKTGKLVLGPLIGHANPVRSVAFSPDGKRVVSGSYDCTLRTWDAYTGALLTGPFEGHTGYVWSAAFSPDGSHIASGSSDGTIRLWDSHTGLQLSKPFRGHTGYVMSVAFSPDGARIVSGAFDDTVRMWSTLDEGVIPLWTSNSHTRDVNCVAFSPDGARVVSGSDDCTILVMDARDGVVLYGPFVGHTDWVWSVAFSSDGTSVVSGSKDQTVRVWDVQSGNVIIGPLQGHTEPVMSVGFSPDSAHIISSSEDGTIRVWDLAATTNPLFATFNHPLDESGWIIDSRSRPLLWVPSYLRKALPRPSDPVVISASGPLHIDYNHLLLGEQWQQCYRGSSNASMS